MAQIIMPDLTVAGILSAKFIHTPQVSNPIILKTKSNLAMLLEIVSMSKIPFHDLEESSISGISCIGILMKQIKEFQICTCIAHILKKILANETLDEVIWKKWRIPVKKCRWWQNASKSTKLINSK